MDFSWQRQYYLLQCSVWRWYTMQNNSILWTVTTKASRAHLSSHRLDQFDPFQPSGVLNPDSLIDTNPHKHCYAMHRNMKMAITFRIHTLPPLEGLHVPPPGHTQQSQRPCSTLDIHDFSCTEMSTRRNHQQ